MQPIVEVLCTNLDVYKLYIIEYLSSKLSFKECWTLSLIILTFQIAYETLKETVAEKLKNLKVQ